MAFDKKRGLLVALEDFSEGGARIGPADDDALMAARVEAETAVDDTVELFDEIEDTREAMDELGEEDTRLRGLIDNVEATAPEGGEPELTENEARFVAAEAADIYRRLGVKRSRMPATESFASPSSRKLATKIALEDWKEKVKEIGKGIVEYSKQLIQKLVSAWQTLIATAAKLKTALAELNKKVNEFDGETGKLKNKALAKAFLIEGSVETDTRVKEVLEAHISASEASNVTLTSFAAGADEFLKGKPEEITDEGAEEQVQSTLAKVAKQVKTRLGFMVSGRPLDKLVAASGDFTTNFKADMQPVLYGPFVGGVTVVIGSTGGSQYMRAKTVSLDFSPAEEYDALTRSGMLAAIKAAEDLLNVQGSLKANLGKLQSLGSKLTSAMANMRIIGSDKKERNFDQVTRKYLKAVVDVVVGVNSIIPRYNVAAVSKTVQLVSASLAATKSEDAPPNA